MLVFLSLLYSVFFLFLFLGEAPSDHALTDQEYKHNMGTGYVFFEIIHPEDLSFTYKINPAAFSLPWNMTLNERILVLADPPCGCGALRNYDDIEC